MSARTPATAPSPLEPALPFDMKDRAAGAAGDVRLRQLVGAATYKKDRGRTDACDAAFGDRYDAVRDLAGRSKQHALDHLDHYLDLFVDRATAAGVHVHFAADAAQANAICAAIAREHACRLCVKSKSMVTEETGLVRALEALGVETVETDLGEFIVQLDGDAPSHIVAPMIHKDRTSVARAFERDLGAKYTEDPERLTMIARAHLRELYRRADLGVSGANFLVAETGSIVICTNEGNADFSVSGPNVHVTMAGIEKVVPRPEDLSILLKLLARSGTAQPLTVYTTVITGPRRAAEHDGPEHVHVILVDNGRTTLLRPESRELLRCIRCGACLNACPVYKSVGGGHAYGAVYSGPIGAVITPLLKGLSNYPDLPQASSLCGACYDACPVAIDIPRHLVRLRGELVSKRIVGRGPRLLMRLWARALKHGALYRTVTALQRLVLRRLGASGQGNKAGEGSQAPYDDRRWVTRIRGPLSGWTDERDLPTPTSRSFASWWNERGNGDSS